MSFRGGRGERLKWILQRWTGNRERQRERGREVERDRERDRGLGRREIDGEDERLEEAGGGRESELWDGGCSPDGAVMESRMVRGEAQRTADELEQSNMKLLSFSLSLTHTHTHTHTLSGFRRAPTSDSPPKHRQRHRTWV